MSCPVKPCVDTVQNDFVHSRFFFPLARQHPQWARASSFTRFLDHTHDARQSVDSSGRVISSSQRPLHDNTQHSEETEIHTLDGIRTHSLSRRAAADIRLRPRGHWDRLATCYSHSFKMQRVLLLKIKSTRLRL